MLAALIDSQPTIPPRKRITRADRAVLEMNGLLDQESVELIEGDLIEKMSKNWPHIHALVILQTWLVKVFGSDFVAPEASFNVAPEDNPTSEPEPDLIVLKRPTRDFLKGSAKPGPEDLHLIVEVSAATLRFDLTVKAALYARAGIAEYWVLDLNQRRLGVHRDPQLGGYQSVVWYGEKESVSPLSAPGAQFVVGSPFE